MIETKTFKTKVFVCTRCKEVTTKEVYPNRVYTTPECWVCHRRMEEVGAST